MNTSSSTITRRRFLRDAVAAIALANSTPAFAADTPPPKQFRLWAIGDAHVGTDLARKRESLAEAIRQSEQGGLALPLAGRLPRRGPRPAVGAE